MRDIATGSNAFALDLWARVAAHTSGNVVFSPASISLAVAMAWGGAKGETAAQMKRALHFAGDEDATGAAWGELARALSAPGRPRELRIANRLFGQSSYAFEEPYLDMTASRFGAPLERLDFVTAYEAARTHINAWVEEQTNKRITGLLPEGTVNALTRLVLVNAIYFLADWAEPFRKDATADEPFHVALALPPKTVPTMHRRGAYAYAQLDRVKVLELPYAGDDAAMFVVLPNERGQLAAVETTLTHAEIETWIRPRATTLVDVALPRFELSPAPLSLGDALAGLGMPLAFGDAADFTGMANPSDRGAGLYISKVLHKAFVKVDEKGTEAAAATAVVMQERSLPPQAILFRADHPFLILIVDKPSGLILFLGRVADPTAK